MRTLETTIFLAIIYGLPALLLFRAFISFPIAAFRKGLFLALRRHAFSLFLVSGYLFITIPNVTAFSWKHWGKTPHAEIIGNAIDYAYGSAETYEKAVAVHFPGFRPMAVYFFEYYDYKEFIYKPSDKYWGDDSYQVMLPEWRVLLDKHGTPYEKEKLHPSDQPERINNEFGIIALFKDGKGLGPVLTESAHFLWERGSTGIATIKGDCLTVFSGSAAPSGKLYARAGTSFLDYVARFDADSYGYGFNIVSVQRFVEKDNGDSEQAVRAISKEEFRQESNCQTQE